MDEFLDAMANECDDKVLRSIKAKEIFYQVGVMGTMVGVMGTMVGVMGTMVGVMVGVMRTMVGVMGTMVGVMRTMVGVMRTMVGDMVAITLYHIQAGTSKAGHPVFYFIARKFRCGVVGVVLLSW